MPPPLLDGRVLVIPMNSISLFHSILPQPVDTGEAPLGLSADPWVGAAVGALRAIASEAVQSQHRWNELVAAALCGEAAAVSPPSRRASAAKGSTDVDHVPAPADNGLRAPGPPGPALLWSDLARAGAEMWGLLAAAPALCGAPHGDGHSVLVIPGLLMDDRHTWPMRSFLASLGYDVHGWHAGRNRGHWSFVDAELMPALQGLRRVSGRKVSIVGASMGGLFARELAARCPDDVRCVVALGSAAVGPIKANNVWPLYEFLTGQPASTLIVPAPPVPSTSVFSRLDGLGDWRTCLQPPGPLAENIEIVSSHHGMVHHPAAFDILADRLAQPEGRWRPMRRAAPRQTQI